MQQLNKGKKYDENKIPVVQGLFNYFPRALRAVAEVSKYGKEKYQIPYSDENWARVEDGLGRYDDALGRHTLAISVDGPLDPESGLLHRAHRAWNALASLELELRDEES